MKLIPEMHTKLDIYVFVIKFISCIQKDHIKDISEIG